MRYLDKVAICCLVFVASASASADEVIIATAANFLAPMRQLETVFEADYGHELTIVSGSTGQLYAQIVNGAPYDVFLAADQERPRLLAQSDLGVAQSLFTYAIGRIVLWSADVSRIDDATIEKLGVEEFRWLAIAEPELAPYGVAAKQALERLGVWPSIQSRLVKGVNISQTFALIETGNAELGVVSLSQAQTYQGQASFAVLPARLHDPVLQDAILLTTASDKAAAQAFMDFLKMPKAQELIEAHFYAKVGSVRR